MYFSRTDLYNFLNNDTISGYHRHAFYQFGEDEVTKAAVARVHKKAMQAVLDRTPDGYDDSYDGEHDNDWSVWKWLRPWDVVPSLRTWSAPEGDFGIGIEVETGFTSMYNAQWVANKVKNWRHITLDFEGGDYPIEATFPPTLYSKFGPKSQACRYLKLLTDNIHRVVEHDGTCEYSDQYGVHVNVSVGGNNNLGTPPLERRRGYINTIIEGSYQYGGMGEELQFKYFGRVPYGGMRRAGDGRYVECKMFETTTDWRTMRRYVDISVELVKFLLGNEPVTRANVVAALERGYTLRS